MSTAIEKVLEIAASNSFDNASVQTCLTAVSDLSNNMDTRMQTKVDAIIDSAPGALNTLNELAAALGDDANFATTVTNSLSQKQASITATTDLTLNDISGNDAKFSDISGVNFFTTGGTFIGNLTGNATTAGTVTTGVQPNITSVGTLTSLNVNGDISGNYINIVKGVNLSFSKDDLSYNQLITHSNAVLNDKMGRGPETISTSGNYLAMGATGANSNGTNDTGAIIVFKKNANGVWTQLTDASGGRLEPFTAANTSFGYNVSINGDYLVGSSRNYSSETTNYVGAIVIYKNTNGTWAKIPDASGGLITATTENSRMGHNLNMYGDFLAVYNDGPDTNGKKKIYIYKNTNGTWALSQTIDKTSVATSTVGRQVLQFYKDEWLIFDGASSKILYVYKNNNGTWEQNTTISDTNKNYYGNKSGIYDGYIALGSDSLSNDIEIWKYDSGTTWNKIQTISNPFTHTGGSYRLQFNKKYLTLICTHTSERETKIYENKNDTYELIETVYGTGLTEYGYNVHLNDSSELFIYTYGDPNNSGEILYYKLDQASDFIFDGSGLNGSNTIFNSKIVMTGDLSGNDASFNNVDITAAALNSLTVDGVSVMTGDLSGNDASFNNVDINAAALNSLTVDGVSVSKTLHVSSSNLSSQVYYENFDAEDVTIHTDSEMTYVTGRDGTGKALNTVGVTPVGLQWVQTLPSGRKAFSFWLKIPSLSSTSNAFDAIILDGRNGSGTGYLMVYYKGGKMYINTSDNAENKLPTKFLIDGTAATLGSWDSTEGKQVGTGQYLQDNSWHHWYLELSTNDTTPSLSWFSGYQVISNETPSSWSQQKKITTTDTATRSFGGGHSQCIATYGDYFAVGDWRTNNSTGAVYLFKKNQGGANNWGQIKKLEASDGAENDRFGFSVDMYGDYIVVGSPYDDDVQGDSGSIYIFKKDQGGTDNWGQLVKRTAEPANSYTEFGFSVAIYDEYIAVGEQSSPNGGSSRGAAYIFEKDISGTDAWGLVKKITSSDSANSDKFGSSIAINGTNVVVGAKGETGSEGALYVFEKDEGGTDNWGEVQKLVANDGASADLLGESVGIYGNYIVSGARGDDDAGNSSGSAYVFKNQSGTWSQIKKLTAGDAAASDSFGVSVSIDGNYIIVGSKGDGDNGISSGSAYIFSKDISGSDAWGQVKKITSDDGVASDAFGRSVVIRGLNIFVISSGNIAKAAYLFSNSTINSTSFFNLEAVVDDYRIFNTSLTDPQINNLSVGGNGNVLGNAIVVPRLDAVDVSCNGIVVTGDISGNDASFNNVDIVGLAVSSLTVGGTTIDTNGSTPINIATTSVSDLSDVSFNTVSSGQVLSWNTAGYFEPTTQTSSGNLNSNSDLSLNNLETTDISSGSISTPSLTTSGTTALGGHIIPDTNSQYDLGSAEYKIRHLFLSNNSLWLGDQHKIDVSGGKMRFKKRKIGTGFVPQEILDASGGSTASEHINAVIAKFGDVTDADDIELHHWYEYIQDPVASGITAGTLLPHQIFLKDDNFAENKDLMNDVKLPVKTDAGAPSTTPATGTMVFNSSDNKLYIYNGGWRYVDTTAV